MLDLENKKNIDDLCDILVAKFPVPQDQVDQITVALTYKFMSDMDKESISMGGKESFFTGNWSKYSWDKLFDPKTTGEDRLNIYKHVIENLHLNENLSPLFRNIFINPPNPFNDLKKLFEFLKIINNFSYKNSETLGNAYEYLLSKTGAQGKLGQFRTPRHIIDFVIEILNPSSSDRVLDPACGTAGFLVSAYKYILSSEKNIDSEKLLSLANNLEGYDIEPKMVRTSLLNLFLQGFQTPRITEFDLLSDDTFWNEYFDIIAANPPFFNPKGGITAHSGFSLKSKRAEIHFLDFIQSHLRPDGRAGVVVPEGILFKKDKAYVEIRKKLLDHSLVGIVSLPSGVFKPYSGVKTSILFLDKKIAKNNDLVFYAKVKNDGYSFSENRSPINENDLPNILKDIKQNNLQSENLSWFLKSKYYEDPNAIFSDLNKEKTDNDSKEFEYRAIGEIASISAGNSAPQDPNLFEDGKFPFIRTSDVAKINFGYIHDAKDYLNERGITKLKLFPKGSILMPKSGQSTLKNYRVMLSKDSYVVSHLSVIKGDNNLVLDKYLLYILRKIDAKDYVYDPAYPSLNKDTIASIDIPLPTLEIQQEIVNELEELQKVINDGERMIQTQQQRIVDKINKVWGED